TSSLPCVMDFVPARPWANWPAPCALPMTRPTIHMARCVQTSDMQHCGTNMAHRPKVIVGLLGIDQHEVGAIAISGLLRDAGMEVIYVGRYNTPTSFTRVALHEDADVIGISCHSWEYLEYVPELLATLRNQALDVDVVLGGSVITPADAGKMRKAGVAAIFGADAK